MGKRKQQENRVSLCEVAGPRGGKSLLSIETTFGILCLGMRRFTPEELPQFVKSKGDRRRVRRRLYRYGFRDAAFKSIFPNSGLVYATAADYGDC